MSIQEKNGDLLKSNSQIICHQVNCFGVMGAGVAKQIKRLYPEVYEEYSNMCHKSVPRSLMGTVLFSKANDGVIVANCFSQLNYGHDANYTDYSCVLQCFEKVLAFATEHNMSTIGIPFKYGCGFAGGDWNIVSHQLEKVFKNAKPTVTVWNFEQN